MTMIESALTDRGVQASLSSLLAGASLDAIERSIEWWDRQSGAGPGVLVEVIRRGGIAESAKPRTLEAQQAAYGAEIAQWLSAKLPDTCKSDRRIVEAIRELYGDSDAEAYERCTSPHPAAIAAVIALHQLHGRGQLTVRQHGPEIRAAVKASVERALSDYLAMIADDQVAA